MATPRDRFGAGTTFFAQPKELQGFRSVERMIFTAADDVGVEPLQLVGEGTPTDVQGHTVQYMNFNARFCQECAGQRGKGLLEEEVVPLARIRPVHSGRLDEYDAHGCRLARQICAAMFPPVIV